MTIDYRKLYGFEETVLIKKELAYSARRRMERELRVADVFRSLYKARSMLLLIGECPPHDEQFFRKSNDCVQSVIKAMDEIEKHFNRFEFYGPKHAVEAGLEEHRPPRVDEMKEFSAWVETLPK